MYTEAAPTYVAAISQALFRAAPGDALVHVLMDTFHTNINDNLSQLIACARGPTRATLETLYARR